MRPDIDAIRERTNTSEGNTAGGVIVIARMDIDLLLAYVAELEEAVKESIDDCHALAGFALYVEYSTDRHQHYIHQTKRLTALIAKCM